MFAQFFLRHRVMLHTKVFEGIAKTHNYAIYWFAFNACKLLFKIRHLKKTCSCIRSLEQNSVYYTVIRPL